MQFLFNNAAQTIAVIRQHSTPGKASVQKLKGEEGQSVALPLAHGRGQGLLNDTLDL